MILDLRLTSPRGDHVWIDRGQVVSLEALPTEKPSCRLTLRNGASMDADGALDDLRAAINGPE